MQLTSAVLIQTLGLCCGEEPDEPGEAVALARQRQPSFAATLLSAWQAEGRELNPALRYELDVQRRRITGFRQTAAALTVAMPRAVPLKGLEVADHYPAGWVRYMNDLDYAVPDQTELWRGVQALLAEGWDLHAGTFVVSGGRLHILISLRRPDEDSYVLPHGVEISTFTSIGDLGGVPMLVELPARWRAPAVKNLLMLLYERFEQQYRARDLLDAALLTDAASGSDLDTLWTALDQLDLWPEYAELAELLGRAEFGPVPSAPRSMVVTGLARRRRTARRFRQLRRPAPGVLRHLQRGMIRGSLSVPERRMWHLAEGRLSAGWALHHGLLTFGLPVEGGRRTSVTAEVGQRGDATWVDTPVGRFLLACGDEISDTVFDAVSADGEPVPTPPAGDVLPGVGSTGEPVPGVHAAGPDR